MLDCKGGYLCETGDCLRALAIDLSPIYQSTRRFTDISETVTCNVKTLAKIRQTSQKLIFLRKDVFWMVSSEVSRLDNLALCANDILYLHPFGIGK